MEDMVNDPQHYKKHYVTITYDVTTLLEQLSFNLGSAFKYYIRRRDKGNWKQDTEKALYYFKRELELIKKHNPGLLTRELTEPAREIIKKNINIDIPTFIKLYNLDPALLYSLPRHDYIPFKNEEEKYFYTVMLEDFIDTLTDELNSYNMGIKQRRNTTGIDPITLLQDINEEYKNTKILRLYEINNDLDKYLTNLFISEFIKHEDLEFTKLMQKYNIEPGLIRLLWITYSDKLNYWSTFKKKVDKKENKEPEEKKKEYIFIAELQNLYIMFDDLGFNINNESINSFFSFELIHYLKLLAHNQFELHNNSSFTDFMVRAKINTNTKFYKSLKEYFIKEK